MPTIIGLHYSRCVPAGHLILSLSHRIMQPSDRICMYTNRPRYIWFLRRT